MRDRPAERAGVGLLDIDVNPLVVAGGVGEHVHLLLSDVDVWAMTQVFADQALQFVGAVDDACGHVRQHATGAIGDTNTPMTDLLTALAESQPDKLAVVDDRGHQVRRLTYAGRGDADAGSNV